MDAFLGDGQMRVVEVRDPKAAADVPPLLLLEHEVRRGADRVFRRFRFKIRST